MKLSHLCLGLLLVSAIACKRDREIKVYSAAKETAAASQPAPQANPGEDPHAGMPGGTAPGAAMPGGTIGDPHAGLTAEQLAAVGAGMPPSAQFTDTAPAHWKKQALSPMRLASYLIQGDGGATADVSFSTLRRAPGGLLANINRWRGQLDQKPIDEAALKQGSQVVKTAFGDAVVVDIEGLAPNGDSNKDGRLIGAIAELGDGAWFFKMRGNAALTESEKANFIQWIQTVKSADPGTAPAAPAGAAPAPAPAPAAAAAAGDGSLTWTVPDGWVLGPVAPGRYATFMVAGAEGAKAELAISHFPGDVGGDLANVNRWRDQIGMEPIDAAALAPLVSKLTAGAKTLSVVDLTGPKTRLTTGWTRHGADTWFFKLSGPDGLVGAEKAKFTAFLESVRFTKPE